MFLDNVIFHFYKGGGHPPDRTPEPQWFFVKSLLTNVNNKMVFFNEGFPKSKFHTGVISGCQDPWNVNPNVTLAACTNITHIRNNEWNEHNK